MKNIALIRTSTIKQEVETQKVEIENAIKKNNDNPIVVIGGAGASAIKMDEIYLANIQSVYNTMERGDVVWAWAIDRIGRNEEVLMAFKNRLIKEGVNLVILNPSLTLLNPDGTVNAGVELAFSLFSTMAKQEMEMKKERFQRAKRRNKEDGKYLGGKVLFGYMVNPNTKKFEIDETKPVRQIFEEYANTPVSLMGLAKKYSIFFKSNPQAHLHQILHRKQYKGNNTYPRIVSDEIYELVQLKFKNYRTLPRYHYDQSPAWCQGLVYHLDDDGTANIMGVKKCILCYQAHTTKICININGLDSLVFHLLEEVFDKYNPTELIEEINTQNAEIKAKKDYLQKELEKLFAKDSELDERYFLAGTVKNYDNLKKSLDLKIKQLQKEINDLQPIKTDIDRPTLDGLNEWQIKDVFNTYISRIYVKAINRNTRKIDIVTTLGVSVSVLLQSKTGKQQYSYLLLQEKDEEKQWRILPIVRNFQNRYQMRKKGQMK